MSIWFHSTSGTSGVNNNHRFRNSQVVSTMILRKLLHDSRYVLFRNVHYTQGQSPKPNIREYFYFIDHQGQLFLDDARMKNFTSCFKEKKFLDFFFTRLRLNETGSYAEDFPFFSPCGRERNYIRCDDKAVVFIHLTDNQSPTDPDVLSYGCVGTSLNAPFEPERICMLPETGRVYHPAAAELGGVGLIKSSIAIAISKYFQFDNGEENAPTHFTWNGKPHVLTNELLPLLYISPSEAKEKLTDHSES